MPNTFYPGIDLQEIPGVFHSMPGVPPNVVGPVFLLDSRGLPFRRDSLPVGTISNPQPDWQYVNVRRFTIYIEQSLSQGLQWVVFQNNTPALWSRAANAIASFLNNQWLQGSLHGSKKQEAYFVVCNNTTMSQQPTWDNGGLVALGRVFAREPQECVIIQIGIQTKKK